VPISLPSTLAGRRFRPGLWPSVAAAIVIAATVSLGNWQARRAEFRGALQDQAQAVAREAPLVLRHAADANEASRYRRASAEGEYVAARQVWLDNRTQGGVAGYHILTPLRLDDGSHLLVDRGWIAGNVRREPPPAPPPAGRVRVEGRLNHPPPSFLELKHAAPSGPVWQNLDLAEFARLSGLAVGPMIIEQAPGDADGLVRDWPPPDLGRDKNIGYMWQWYGLATLTAVLWLVLGWRKA
jgi:surfeit locus 1 family protein